MGISLPASSRIQYPAHYTYLLLDFCMRVVIHYYINTYNEPMTTAVYFVRGSFAQFSQYRFTKKYINDGDVYILLLNISNMMLAVLPCAFTVKWRARFISCGGQHILYMQTSVLVTCEQRAQSFYVYVHTSAHLAINACNCKYIYT